ncbi:MAG: T9SS type A sorting domain-containing protein [Bacteroidia bacterium]
MKKPCFILFVIAYFSISVIKAQTTFSWVNYTTNSTYTPWTAQPYMYTMTGSGYTDNVLATLTSSAGTGIFTNSTPKYSASSDPAGAGCSTAPPGLLLRVDWSNSTSNVIITIDFNGGTNGVCGPLTFSVYDINDDGFGSWQDAVSVSATDASGAALNVSKVGDCNAGASPASAATGNGTSLLTFKSGMSSSCTCWPNNSVTIGTATTVIKTLTIKYFSVVSPSWNNSPQYVSISNISTGGFGCAAITLPIELTSFSGKCAGNEKKLEWTTANETNNSHFTIEHSANGVEFADIAEVNSHKGNSKVSSDYKYTFNEENSNYKYYRLSQTDLNGNRNILRTLYIDCIDRLGDINLSPNPADNKIMLEFQSSSVADYEMNITDVTGRTVQSMKYLATEGNNLAFMDVSRLSKGIYHVVIADANGSYRPQIIKFIKTGE